MLHFMFPSPRDWVGPDRLSGTKGVMSPEEHHPR